jgi:hypothetical protein
MKNDFDSANALLQKVVRPFLKNDLADFNVWWAAMSLKEREVFTATVNPTLCYSTDWGCQYQNFPGATPNTSHILVKKYIKRSRIFPCLLVAPENTVRYLAARLPELLEDMRDPDCKDDHDFEDRYVTTKVLTYRHHYHFMAPYFDPAQRQDHKRERAFPDGGHFYLAGDGKPARCMKVNGHLEMSEELSILIRQGNVIFPHEAEMVGKMLLMLVIAVASLCDEFCNEIKQSRTTQRVAKALYLRHCSACHMGSRVALMSCGCGLAAYCNPSCQAAHRNEHKTSVCTLKKHKPHRGHAADWRPGQPLSFSYSMGAFALSLDGEVHSIVSASVDSLFLEYQIFIRDCERVGRQLVPAWMMFGFPVLKAENIAEFVSKQPETFFAVVDSDGSVNFYETKDQKFGQQSLLTFEEWDDVNGVADGVDFLPPDTIFCRMFAANAAGRVHRNK